MPKCDSMTPGVAQYASMSEYFVTQSRWPKLGAFSSGRWVPSPHLYVSGNLCVADRSEWDPVGHDVATAVAWGAHWLAAYTEWRMSRHWPVDGAQADAA